MVHGQRLRHDASIDRLRIASLLLVVFCVILHRDWTSGCYNAAGLSVNAPNLGQLKKNELQALLRERGLPHSGLKADLIQRLSDAELLGPSENPTPGSQSDDTDEADQAGIEDRSLEVGSEIEAFWDGAWYSAEVLAVSDDGTTCGVRYHLGEDEEFDIDVATRTRKLPPPWVKTGLRVEVEWDRTWFPARVLSVNPSGRIIAVKFDFEGYVECGVRVLQRVRPLEGAEEEYKASRVSLTDLEPGQKLHGVVTTIEDFGFFVDVGTERDGLVPVGRASAKCVKDLHEVVAVGEEVVVWVSHVGGDGKLELALVKDKVRGGRQGKRKQRQIQDLSGFADLPATEWFKGLVTGFAPFGIFVEVKPPGGGSPVKGVVHISQIQANGFLKRPQKAGYKVGDELQLRIYKLDMKLGRLDLTLLPTGSE